MADVLLQAKITEITTLPTAETDTELVLAPDGLGGIEFRAETGGGGGSGAVGRSHICVPFGFVHDRPPTADNIAVDAAYAVPVVISTPLYLDHLRYQSRDASGARSIEFALYRDDGSASAVQVAHGSESFTGAGTAIRTPAFDSAPVTVPPGEYWLVIRDSHASATLGIGFQVLDTSLLVRQQTKTTVGALGSTLDLSSGWTRTSSNIPHAALVGRVFGEASAF